MQNAQVSLFKLFRCAYEQNEEPPVEKIVTVSAIAETGPIIILSGKIHRYYNKFAMWKSWEFKIMSNARFIIANEHIEMEKLDWHKIRLGEDAVQLTDRRPLRFPTDTSKETTIFLPIESNPYFCFDTTAELLNFVEAIMKVVKCTDAVKFFDGKNSRKYYEQLVKMRKESAGSEIAVTLA